MFLGIYQGMATIDSKLIMLFYSAIDVMFISSMHFNMC